MFTTDMNRKHLAETRRESTCTDVGNADIAYVHGWTVVGQCRSSEAVCRGANIYHPWGLGIRIPAADGLSNVLPIHVSRYYLWGSSYDFY